MLASAERLEFSGVLGEVATFDGVHIYFWGFGPPMKCRARIKVSGRQRVYLTMCYAGCWFVMYNGDSVCTMIPRCPGQRLGTFEFYTLPSVPPAPARAHIQSVHGLGSDMLAISTDGGCMQWLFNIKDFVVYRQHGSMQWMHLYRVTTEFFVDNILHPQSVLSSTWAQPKQQLYRLTATGPELLNAEDVVFGFQGRQMLQDAQGVFCGFSLSVGLWSCKYMEWVLGRHRPLHWVHMPVQGYCRRGNSKRGNSKRLQFTVYVPRDQQGFERNCTPARFSWISACM